MSELKNQIINTVMNKLESNIDNIIEEMNKLEDKEKFKFAINMQIDKDNIFYFNGKFQSSKTIKIEDPMEQIEYDPNQLDMFNQKDNPTVN